MKSKQVTMRTLLKQGLAIPEGCHVEVYMDKGNVTFSAPLTQNTWTKDPEKIGEIEAFTFGDIRGFFKRSDGKVEIEAAGKKKGEFYSQCAIVSVTEAINRLVEIAYDEDWEQVKLLQKSKKYLTALFAGT